MSLTVAALLERLKNTPAVDLLETYDHTEYLDLWDADPSGPRVYRALARALLNQGHPSLALNLARRGLEREPYKTDPELNYTVALAYVRGGNPTSAEERLAPLLEAARADDAALPAGMTPRLRMDIVALEGRLAKDLYQREKDPTRRRELAARSAANYLRAGRLPGADGFPLVNAATMSRLAGDVDAARRLAGEALERTLPALQAADGAGDYWLQATVGEAHVLLGENEKSVANYRAAVELAWKKGAVGDLVVMFGNLRLLAEAGATAEPVWLRERLGSVVVFSGHRVDPPERAEAGLPPRFPNDPGLVNRVKTAIRERLAAVKARFGFCSLASGADILFAEAMLERDAELQVVLPFARDDFLTVCVDYGQANDPRYRLWRHRFEALLGQLKPGCLHYATTEPYLGTEVLFGYANAIIQGVGTIRAAQCLIEPLALVVLDPATASLPSFAGEFLESWRRRGLAAEVIDLSALRGDLPGSRPRAHTAPAATPARAELPRVLRAMLFADVAHFSQMNEVMAPRFFAQFPRAVARVLDTAGVRVLLANTWGDGFFAVFGGVGDCAGFALELLDEVGRCLDWRGLGFPDANPLRVGLHAGPVYELADDPILHRRNFFGQHVNRAARIEPVTIPGCAFASEQFAALLTMQAPDAFRCEAIGLQQLPKKSGNVGLYRVGRK